MKTVRVTVDLSPELYEKVQKMADQSHSTKAEIMRKSLGLLSAIQVAIKQEDRRLAIVDNENEVVTEIISY